MSGEAGLFHQSTDLRQSSDTREPTPAGVDDEILSSLPPERLSFVALDPAGVQRPAT